MTKEERTKLLGELGKTSYGKALKEYLLIELKDVDTVVGVKTIEESRGREISLGIIKRLFSFMDLEKPKDVGEKTIYS